MLFKSRRMFLDSVEAITVLFSFFFVWLSIFNCTGHYSKKIGQFNFKRAKGLKVLGELF